MAMAGFAQAETIITATTVATVTAEDQIPVAMHLYAAHVLIIPGDGQVVQVVVQVVDRAAV